MWHTCSRSLCATGFGLDLAPNAMIKVVFFDIDGTLLSQRTNRVPDSARRAIRALREQGVKVVVATGRHPIELDGAGLNDLEFDGFAAANGQMLLDGDRRLFGGYPIPPHGVEALVRLYETGERLLWFFGETDCYVNREDEVVKAMSAQVSGLVPEVRPYAGDPLYQAVAFVDVSEEEVLQRQLTGCRLQRWGSMGVDIIAVDGGKVEGMKVFLQKFGCTREECMAFGDQHNDLDMLRFAGIGVAMGNGAPEVKAAADYVTRSVDDDGVAYALEQLGVLHGTVSAIAQQGAHLTLREDSHLVHRAADGSV